MQLRYYYTLFYNKVNSILQLFLYFLQFMLQKL
nr:MAG TPA: hypothetical protein [Caudoviricetes sp.]